MSSYYFYNYPKEHYYQLLDQSDNFPGTSSNFTAESGGHVRSEKRAKNAIKRKFFGGFFKINDNHLITKFDQILGHFEHF